ncbi:uncharacterized protein DUF2796 [Pacificibacter maritimus]|uniref:Uncharacterized protein DUF2796 n=1 Tax=Pacificibacter maritimus TaxID=762213 RepID=A0A3N4UKY3_9RHOB|nr:DUF2796 domain-containing protein [Pacificibacter maritimus]RPE71262.1 uncharacterized protein DUF2796 [Pacificibacter maritimus]
MKLLSLTALSLALAAPAMGDETRQLEAHEHGVGLLNIALDGDDIAIELRAAGADIVGFEYEAQSDADIAKVSAALNVLAEPLKLFSLPATAQCSVVDVKVDLESEAGHDAHDHDDHDGDDHDDHDAHEHAAHDHDDHDEHEHDDHDAHDHDAHEHDDHEAHDDHDAASGHTEFHVEYRLTCEDLEQIQVLTTNYFDIFPNAMKLTVQAVSQTGAAGYEMSRDTAFVSLTDLF